MILLLIFFLLNNHTIFTAQFISRRSPTVGSSSQFGVKNGVDDLSDNYDSFEDYGGLEQIIGKTSGGGENNSTDLNEYPDYYEEYDYGLDDYNYDEMSTLDALSGLSPEFLAKVSPSFILGFLSGVSSEEIDSVPASIFLHIPVETLVSVIDQLPENIVLSLIKSQGVRNLFEADPRNLTIPETKFLEIQAALSGRLLVSLSPEAIESIPTYLINANLVNLDIIQILLKNPDKLDVLVEKFSSLLHDIPFSLIVEALTTYPDLSEGISENVLSKILSCPFLSNIEENDFSSLSFVISKLSSKLTHVMKRNPSFLSCIPDKLLQTVAQNEKFLPHLDKSFLYAVIEVLPQSRLESLIKLNITSNLPENVLDSLLENDKILKIIRTLPEEDLLQLSANPQLFSSLSVGTVKRLLLQVPELLQLDQAGLLKALEHFPRDDLKKLFLDEDLLEQVAKAGKLESLIRHEEVLNVIRSVPDRELVRLLESQQLLFFISVDTLVFLSEKLPHLLPLLPSSILIQLSSNKVVMRQFLLF